MAVTLVFLGKLADKAGADRQLDAPLDWNSLLARLEPDLAAAVQQDNIRIARNGSILTDRAGLSAVDGDEIAFLPPVSGG